MTYEKFADGTTKDISDELPFDLPPGWAWARLKRVGAISTGPFGSNLHQGDYVSNGTPIVNPINMVDGRIIPDKYISQETQKRLSEYILHPGMIVLGRRGEMGRCAIVSEHQDGWLCGTGSFFIRLHGEIDSFYVRLLFTSQYARAIFEGDSKGTTMFNLSQGTLSHLLFPVPPLVEQKRIVAKVEEFFAYVDEIGEASESIAKTAQRINKKTLDLAIRGQLVPQDASDEPASELVKRIEAARKSKSGGKNSRASASDRPAYEIDPPFDIPGTWEWVRLGAISNYGECQTIDANDIPSETWSLDLEEIEKGTGRLLVRRLAGEKASTSSKHKFCKGMILYSKLRTYLNKVLIADMDGVCTSEIIPITLHEDILPEYIRTVLMSPYFLAYTANKDYGVKMPRVGTADARAALIPLPPIAEQKRIVSKVEALKSMTRTLVVS